MISIVRAGREVKAAETKSEGPTADALDKEQLDQLHAATLKAADSCFELKKLCATVLVPAGVLVATFSDKKLNPAVFVAGFMVIAAFWIADAFSFYYQRRLRVLMKDIWNRRAERCAEGYDHVQKVTAVSWFRAAFNSSMIYYLILAAMVGAALAAYASGVLRGTP
ncbi:hypothetical protein SAMN04489729_4267 [Amycolatopsis lurida]|uniref:Uncharacterized protein n=1 Tax=Amycolatopsis lurida NRRL 2430 TaxID=1460371 RepID=A0A2P2FFJ1_AMYLU|nr:hypothetical protein BB31_41290 [Amycolatopsis lurida NRRL 2430]SED40939.1 hypothetical protein SAMN04489729_4267 [Amycolatopsis lurida]